MLSVTQSLPVHMCRLIELVQGELSLASSIVSMKVTLELGLT